MQTRSPASSIAPLTSSQLASCRLPGCLLLSCLLLGCVLSGCGAYDQITAGPSTRPAAGPFAAFFQPPPPDQAARWAIDDLNADNRYRGTIILANAPYAGEDVYLELFRDNMRPDREPYAIVRGAAVRGLAHHGLPDADVPLLLEALDDEPAVEVRVEIVRALQRLHNPVAVRPLITILTDLDENTEMRAMAANALAQYTERRVLDALILALDDDALLINDAALASLRTLTGQDLPPTPQDWFAWLARARDPFDDRSSYEYPVFSRGLKYYEWLPLIPGPPNEVTSTPAGFPEPEYIPPSDPQDPDTRDRG